MLVVRVVDFEGSEATGLSASGPMRGSRLSQIFGAIGFVGMGDGEFVV
jgi:hypothetical protein